MSRSVPVLLAAALLLAAGCFDRSELDVRRAAGVGGVAPGAGEAGGGADGALGGADQGADDDGGDGGGPAANCPAPGVPVGVSEGSVMADPRLKDRDRERVSLYDNCGRVTIVGIGAGWCIGCRAEMPEFVHWQEELPEDLGIYYLLWQDDLSQPAASTFAGDWADQYSANFPILTDPTASVRNGYAPSLDLPTTILLDRQMVIRKIRFYASVERLRFDVDELIAE